MDINGFVKILLTSISAIFAWLSRNYSESSTNNSLCDTCGEFQPTNSMRQVWGGVDICDTCVDKILSLFVVSNPIKTLCPFCSEEEDDSGKCEYCDIKYSMENVSCDS